MATTNAAAAKTQPATAQDTSIAERQPTNSERFTNRVLAEFRGKGGELHITDYQRQLIHGYFLGIDRALKLAEESRLRKSEQYRDSLPVIWQNVNMPDLAVALVHYARMGLDMMQKNHLHAVPYKNNKTNQYDITLMPGYSGIQYVAAKYAMDPPLDITIELVHETDVFRPIKKSLENKIESYEFEIANAFNRGPIVGGFGYIEFKDTTKNKLIIMSIADIEKRKPAYASPEFWGGEKDVWEEGENGKRHKVKKNIDGWYEHMCYKTLVREVYSERHIPRDPKKVDDAYWFMRVQEIKAAQAEAAAEHDAYANKTLIQADGYVVDTESGEIIDEGDGIPDAPQEEERIQESPLEISNTKSKQDATAPEPPADELP